MPAVSLLTTGVKGEKDLLSPVYVSEDMGTYPKQVSNTFINYLPPSVLQ